jgi:hypothetical protein
MSLRLRHVAALALIHALSFSCSDDDDATPTSAGMGGKDGKAGLAGAGTGGKATGGSTTEGGSPPAHSGEAAGGDSSQAGMVSGAAGDPSGLAGDGGASTAGAPGTGGAGTAGDTGAGGEGGIASVEYDFSCDFPAGTPCFQDVSAGVTLLGQLMSTADIQPGNVYVVSILAEEDIDLRVCGSAACEGDQSCESSGAGGDESCVLQASQDFLSLYVTNNAGAPANVRVDMDNDAWFEFKLSYVQSSSSLGANMYRRIMVTGLTPQTTYEFRVETTNARPINLLASSDLHAEQVLCDEDLMGTAATCQLTVTASTIWVLLTDTSGIGDGFTFKVTAL